MNEILKTDRLILREIDIKFSAQVYDIMKSYPEMGTYMTWGTPTSVEEVAQSIQNQIDQKNLLFGLFLHSNPEVLIGRVTLRNFVWWERDAQKTSAFLSFWISPEYGGKGYGTEMLRTICRYAFINLKLRKIFAGVFIQNIPSQRLLNKVGFQCIGVSRKHYLKDGVEYDSARYELCVGDFLNSEETPLIPDKTHRTKFDHYSADHEYKTDHLFLRNLSESDGKEVFESLLKHQGFETYLSWNMPKDIESVREKIIRTRDDLDINLGAYRAGKFIGRGIIRNLRFAQDSAFKNSAFISFWLLPPFHGALELELATELCRIAFEELNLRKIFVPIFAENKRMKSIIEKLPFTLIGRLKNHYRKNDIEHDSLRYEMLAEDWKRYKN